MSDRVAIVPRLPPPLPVKKASIGIVGVLNGVLLGVLLGLFGPQLAGNLFMVSPSSKWYVLLCVAVLPLVWFGVVAFHECGHLVGGWLIRGRFLLLSVGPLMVRRTPQGIRLTWNRSVNVLGGMGACLPHNPEQVTPKRMAVMILGGPAASLVAAGVLFGLASFLANDKLAGHFHGFAQHLAVIAALLSSLIFLLTVYPATIGGMKTDGNRVLGLLRGDHRSEQEAAMLLLTAASLAGERPAHHSAVLVARVISLKDGSLFDFYGHFTAYYHAADRQDWCTAQDCLDYILTGEKDLMPHIRDVLRCEYAWLLATRSEAVAEARAWLDTAGKLQFDPATRLRAEAAVLLAEGKRAEAAEKCRLGFIALETKSMAPVRSVFTAEAFEEILAIAGAPRQANSI